MAIPAPAPSIPQRFRLYHGGAPKRGWLVTHDRSSLGWLGDVVYFSPHHDYARAYLGARHGSPAALVRGQGLFVVDARTLPPGCRVLVGGASAADSIVEERLVDLIEAIWFAHDWLAAGEARPGRVRRELARLARRALRRRDDHGDDPSSLSERSVRVIAAALGGPPRPDPQCRPADRFSSMLLYLVEAYGTIAPTRAQVEAAVPAYRRDWLAAFSVPLNPLAVHRPGPRSVDTWPAAGDGQIVLVPGPIPVLPKRYAAGRPQRRNLPSGPMMDRSTKSSPVWSLGL